MDCSKKVGWEASSKTSDGHEVKEKEKGRKAEQHIIADFEFII